METKTDLAGALYKTLSAVLTLLEETMESVEDGGVRLADAKIKAVVGVGRVIGTLVTAFCRLGLTGDDHVNDKTTLEQYRAEVDRRLAALDAQIERKRAEIAAKKAALAGEGGKGRHRRGGSHGTVQLEERGSPSPVDA